MNILLTGITGDIGKSISKILLEKDINLFGCYRSNENSASDLLRFSEEQNGKIHLFKGDITDNSFLKETIESIQSKYGEIDVLINNAGRNHDDLFLNMVEESWKSIMETNLLSNIFLTEILLSSERKKTLKIINVVSVSAVYGREGQTNYSCSKGGVIGYSKLLSTRKISPKIEVINVAPGMIDSEMVSKVPTDSLNNFLQYTSSKQVGDTRAIAEFIDYYLHSKETYLTNTTIKLDGGFMR